MRRRALRFGLVLTVGAVLATNVAAAQQDAPEGARGWRRQRQRGRQAAPEAGLNQQRLERIRERLRQLPPEQRRQAAQSSR